eukprot:TRINITY_DN586_c0_g2_i2.p1 TRINITY_DN586_c0_g2~~TRINITY_DN586_c0_g2_i2.p1  ORF type:complete len:339 (+),score=81.48 TRINITY_DN586_c0_g2_i2:87-1103(+)
MATKAHVVLITGATSGIGLGLAKRLSLKQNTVVCVTARNDAKGKELLAELRTHQEANKAKFAAPAKLEYVIMDVSNTQSVLRGAADFSQRFDRLDVLYLNAGIYPQLGLDWIYFFKMLVTGQFMTILETGGDLLKEPVGKTTGEGYGEVFATNVLGHYLLCHKLLPLLEAAAPSRIVWTGSRTASPLKFNIDDLQGLRTSNPYSSSKYAVDMITVAWNEKYNSRGVYMYSSCPGAVFTKVAPWFMVWLTPIFYLIGYFISNFRVSTDAGCEVLYRLGEVVDVAKTDPLCKYRMEWDNLAGYPIISSEDQRKAAAKVEHMTTLLIKDKIADVGRRWNTE